MLVLPGSAALSDARFQLLAESVTALDPSLRLREVNYAYAVDVAAELPDEDRLAALFSRVPRRPQTLKLCIAPGIALSHRGLARSRRGRVRRPISPATAVSPALTVSSA
ncbi:MAG: hypothetical protein CM15mP74_03980 [Halieaceae bacterium]|nr:MAG: hypothetical protein CM15mP74_03980 [Halieaceae bacterium]